MPRICSQVKPAYDGLCLGEYLSRRFTYKTEAEWKEEIAAGRFSVNEIILQQHHRVCTGDTLVYLFPDEYEEPGDLSYHILYEQDDFLAVHKPPRLLVHNNKKTPTQNLIYQLRECHSPSYPTADIIHRLDRNTSGVILISKNKRALVDLQKKFSQRQIDKTYYAIISGVPKKKEGCLQSPITIGASGKIKEAVTTYRVVSATKNHAVVELSPRTGYTHQLRIHCAHMHTPILYDTTYGASTAPPGSRQMLHCAALTFAYKNRIHHITSPLPDDFKTTMNRLNLFLEETT
ncbi:RluA family pseudouridine synthase [Chitinivibrio alkaliphilus]|uniref:Pseudouridine synthase, RsuA/RluD family n=1 Tax=Chitinivibrio alkaliphilus ACht1 TaxID=1313304 RepID=U7D7W2_9BACT|nr:RluA family pseudouridine synthase [Chitinivibrio alkaliphilus]ERP32028.1 Pseudouridine synthase, RsuA/RluD family [Chitinivibrio alkaliphilus ACht1]